jgi:hypothetical protein
MREVVILGPVQTSCVKWMVVLKTSGTIVSVVEQVCGCFRKSELLGPVTLLAVIPCVYKHDEGALTFRNPPDAGRTKTTETLDVEALFLRESR